LRTNYIGIAAGIIAFISLAWPWWTFIMSAETMGFSVSVDLSVSLYQARASAMGMSQTVTMDLWFGWAALALILIAALGAIVGSTIIGKTGKTIILVAGILALLSIIVFAAGLQNELSKAPPASGFPKVGLFSTGSWNLMGTSMDYSSYLTFGFWLALIAAILSFISLGKHPITPPAATPAATPTPES